MSHTFGVTITTNLQTSDIRDNRAFSHVCVIDLRRCVNNGAYPIEEGILRRLANFRVDYEQLPMSLYSRSSRAENELLRMITEQRGNVLIVTDHPVPLARFCRELDIPFKSNEMYLVETAGDYIPVQMKPQPKPAANFGSFGG